MTSDRRRKENRIVSIMTMHAVKCLLTIFGGGKVIPGRLLQGVRGGLRLMIHI